MTKTALADVRAARLALEAETREALLSAAANILSREGAAALTVRRVAEAVNASTKMIYTHFGGKDGLLEAVYLHGFGELDRGLQGHADVSDPAERLAAMVTAYREFALREPAFYAMMFGDLGRAWEPPLESRRQAWRSFGTLREAVRAALGEREDQAQRATYHLWAATHGVVSLEMRGLIGATVTPIELLEEAFHAVCQANRIAYAPLPRTLHSAS